MRKYHRWLAPIFAIFLLWISVTGTLAGTARLLNAGEPERPRPAAASTPAPTAPRPPQSPARQFIHFVTELHSGEQFGRAGQIVSILSGLALIFFAASGLWMYIQMFRGRLVKAERGGTTRGGRWFW